MIVYFTVLVYLTIIMPIYVPIDTFIRMLRKLPIGKLFHIDIYIYSYYYG